jgi:hypothetical protein
VSDEPWKPGDRPWPAEWDEFFEIWVNERHNFVLRPRGCPISEKVATWEKLYNELPLLVEYLIPICSKCPKDGHRLTIDQPCQLRHKPSSDSVNSCPRCLNRDDIMPGWRGITDEIPFRGFLEAGKWDGKQFDVEQEVRMFQCPVCGCCFAIAWEERDAESRRRVDRCPAGGGTRRSSEGTG